MPTRFSGTNRVECQPPFSVDPFLQAKFFALIEDADVDVRRMSLVAFNSAAHHKPTLVRDTLQRVN